MIGFPRTVNEKAARTVAAGVVALSLLTIATQQWWLAVPLAYGFWARVLTGPRLSPLALLATRVAAPRLGPPREAPGPPKRFAQAIGAVLSTAAVLLGLGLGLDGLATAVLAVLVVAASLEAAFGICLGCRIFAALMRSGVVPVSVCEECADIWSRART
jgi:hypothetical protein